MVHRSAKEWRALFGAQARSGLTAAAFCREQGLCPKYFSLRKKELGSGAVVAEVSPFVRVKPVVAAASEALESRVRLRLGRCEWEVSGMALDDLATLMARLA